VTDPHLLAEGTVRWPDATSRIAMCRRKEAPDQRELLKEELWGDSIRLQK